MIYIQNISLERPEINPKNSNLNLNIDFNVDFKNVESNLINYTCLLKSLYNFNMCFKVEGIMKMGSGEIFSKEECSQLVFDNSITVLMNLISLTKENEYFISSNDDLGTNSIDNCYSSKYDESGEKIYTNINQLYY